MPNRALLLALALAPSAAVAQTFTILESADSDLIINKAECNNTTADGLSFNWIFPAFVAGGAYTLTASDTVNCPASTTTQVVQNNTLSSSISATSATGVYPTSGSVSIPPLLRSLQITCDSAKSAVFFCVTLSSATTTTAQVTGSITLDLTTPPKPVITTVTAGDTALNLTWTTTAISTVTGGTPGSADSYRIFATRVDDPTKTISTDFLSPGSLTSGRIGGLANGVAYDVTVQAFSKGRNPGDVSDAARGTPVPVNDFWRIYKADGGREQGGCGLGGAGLVALLALPLALGARRRRS